MKRFFLLVFTLFLLPLTSVLAQSEQDSLVVDSAAIDTVCVDSTLTVQQRIEKLLEMKMFDTSQVALMVWNLDADSLVFARNERQLMRPASTLKLLTAITALDRLGKDFMLCTRIYADGSCDSTGYNGNIYVKGCMDPTLCSTDLDAFVSGIAKLQGDTIRGKLIADLSFKDDDRMGNGWCWDDDNPVLSPLLYKRKDEFLKQLRSRLKTMNIVVLGGDSVACVPAGARLLEERCSTIGNLLPRMLKNSDNLYAESVLYQFSGGTGKKATQKSSWQQEARVMRKAGLNPDLYKVADGSGLSLYNYLSAEAEVKLLRFAYNDKRIYDPLYYCLPVSGVDGTIKSRLRGTALQGKVHAKTGTLTGISTLAGYLTTSSGQNLAFCIFNQGILSGRKAKSFQDSVLKALY